ncbi:hypothetical protein FRC12_006680 [Ceratobasidium sp. 428]|nr:hypothetical protein FRC12_006680 [Ceratobasidium sp. 428]
MNKRVSAVAARRSHVDPLRVFADARCIFERFLLRYKMQSDRLVLKHHSAFRDVEHPHSYSLPHLYLTLLAIMPFFSKKSRSGSDSSSVQSSSSFASLLHKDAPFLTEQGASSPAAQPTSGQSKQDSVSFKTQYRPKDFGATSNKYGGVGYGSMSSGV